MTIEPIKDADISLCEVRGNHVYCKLHGAMLKLTKDGIWRCMTTYKRAIDGKVGEISNNCKAGCCEARA